MTVSRRTFLASLAAAPELLAADPNRLFSWRASPPPIRIRGRVTADGRPVVRAAVSDGITVVTTDRDGRYELLADPMMPAVFVSTPAGCALPVSGHGTLQQHVPLNGRAEQRADFALRSDPHPEAVHGFVALSDPQMLDADDMAAFHATTVPAVIETVREFGSIPVFGVAVGDILYDHLEWYSEYERAVSRIGIPFAQVVGNHDLDLPSDTDAASTRTFCRHFGPERYSFNRGEVHYVVLDDVLWHGRGYIGHLDAGQLNWLKQDLALVEPGTTVVVFLHMPASSTTPERLGATTTDNWRLTNAGALWRLLEPYRAHLISGHTHEQEHTIRNDRCHEHNLATSCGAWWTGPVCWDGTPRGYGVYHVQGSELRWRYQATGLPATNQMTVYPLGSEPTAPGEIVANVWNWDPDWTVTWYEGADRRGPMSRRRGRDPLAVQLYAGADLPAKHRWVEPILTDHLFYAPARVDHAAIVVEAIDRFGQRFVSEQLTRG
jgi:3',5'-cyclic AMP phosphodiesterase CpdA